MDGPVSVSASMPAPAPELPFALEPVPESSLEHFSALLEHDEQTMADARTAIENCALIAGAVTNRILAQLQKKRAAPASAQWKTALDRGWQAGGDRTRTEWPSSGLHGGPDQHGYVSSIRYGSVAVATSNHTSDRPGSSGRLCTDQEQPGRSYSTSETCSLGDPVCTRSPRAAVRRTGPGRHDNSPTCDSPPRSSSSCPERPAVLGSPRSAGWELLRLLSSSRFLPELRLFPQLRCSALFRRVGLLLARSLGWYLRRGDYQWRPRVFVLRSAQDLAAGGEKEDPAGR